MEPTNSNLNSNMNPQTPNAGVNQSNVRWIVLGVLVVALIVLGLLLSKNLLKPKGPVVTGEPAPGVEVTKADTSLPDGFLESIPLEVDNIIEAQKAYYVELGTTQYSVTYFTASTTNQKYSEYYRYFAANGFTTSGEGSNREEGRIFSSRGNEEVLVLMVDDNGLQKVTVNYVVRTP